MIIEISVEFFGLTISLAICLPIQLDTLFSFPSFYAAIVSWSCEESQSSQCEGRSSKMSKCRQPKKSVKSGFEIGMNGDNFGQF